MRTFFRFLVWDAMALVVYLVVRRDNEGLGVLRGGVEALVAVWHLILAVAKVVGAVVAKVVGAVVPDVAKAVAVVGAVVLAVVAVMLACFLIGGFGRAIVHALAAEWFGRDGPELVRSGADSPGYPGYYRRQAFVDARTAWREGTAWMRRTVAGRVGFGLAGWLCRGCPPPSPDGPPSVPEWLSVPAGIGVGAATGAGLALASPVTVAIMLVYLAVIGVFGAAAGLAAVTLRGLDRAWLAVRATRLACPHPDCYTTIRLPVYQCPSPQCPARHRTLRPGGGGVFQHVCECKATLPTSLLLGRHRLGAYCPQCTRPLPSRLGATPAAHVALVGSTSAGKSMLLMAMLIGLVRLADTGRGAVEFANRDDEENFQRLRPRLESGGFPPTTDRTRPPTAFLCYLGRRRHRKLLYFYDPAGEFWQSADGVVEQGYLRHIGGLVFVVDPFAVPYVRRHASSADAEVVRGARPAAEDPESAYHRLISGLRGAAGDRAGHLPIAVVVSKLDAFRQLGPSVPAPAAGEAATRDWLAEVGLGSLLRSIAHDLGQCHYATVSARDAASGREADGTSVTAPLVWLLSQLGSDLAPTAPAT